MIPSRSFRAGSLATTASLACLLVPPDTSAQDRRFLPQIDSLGLERATVGRVTTLFAPEDRARAHELGDLSEAAASFFARELGVSFEFQLAVLGPAHWFSPHGVDLPYGIPWCSVAEALIVTPSSLTEGALIAGGNDVVDRKRVDFVTLHEFGHLAAKRYLHPASAYEEMPILWFEEFVATYFAYAFLSSFDPRWLDFAREDWAGHVDAYAPRIRSLDWTFMRALPPDELAPTYGWYQNVLNLRAADVHAEHSLGFLRMLREELPVHAMDAWTTESLLEQLERLAPGFQEWADALQEGESALEEGG